MSRSPLKGVHLRIDRTWSSVLADVREAIQAPSFSDTGEGIGAAARQFRALVGRLCPDAEVVATPGHPVVLGTRRDHGSDVPTLLLYGLYDVTPTIAHEWSVDPMAADILPATELRLDPALGDILVGRGAHNHKGPVISALAGLLTLVDEYGSLPVNLVVVIEGEEEVGSPSLAGFLADHADRIGTIDGIWLPCMQQSPTGTMALRRAYKGCLWTQLTCRGGSWGGARDGRHLWAGHSAWIDAPMMRLVKALSTLYDSNQRAAFDGAEELSRPHLIGMHDQIEEVRAGFAEHPERTTGMLEILGVDRALNGKDLAEHVPAYSAGVTLNIQGIDGGYGGPSYYTMMPGWARAKLDVRFPPGVEVDTVAELIRAHLDRRGFHEVVLENTRGYPGLAERNGRSDVLLTSARAAAAGFGVDVRTWPMANNCCPASLFGRLGDDVPFSVAGLGHGDRPHAPDEYITVDSVRLLMHFTVEFVAEIAAVRSGAHG